MDNLTFFDGVIVSLICIFVVFVILIGLYIVISLFKYAFKDNSEVTFLNDSKILSANQSTSNVQVVDEESKTVAMLMALVLANNDEDNKVYEVVSIENKN